MILHHLYLIRIRPESEEGRTADPQIATKACSADVCGGGRPMPPRAPMCKNSKPNRAADSAAQSLGFSKPTVVKNSGETASRNSAKQRDLREVILRFRERSPEDQQAVVEFLKQL